MAQHAQYTALPQDGAAFGATPRKPFGGGAPVVGTVVGAATGDLAGAERYEHPDEPPAEVKSYNVVNRLLPCACIPCTAGFSLIGCCVSHTLTMEAEEVVVDYHAPLACGERRTSRRPYGELGSVEIEECCGCCLAVATAGIGEQLRFSPGFSCNRAVTTEIHDELERRMWARGDAAQIRRAEQVNSELGYMNMKVSQMMAKLGLREDKEYPPEDYSIPPPLETKVYDVQGYLWMAHPLVFALCCWFVPCMKKTLTLGPENVKVRQVCCWGTYNRVKPYGELGDVQLQQDCWGCLKVNSSLREIQPGCGCKRELTEAIYEEMRARQRVRGDTARIRRTEQAAARAQRLRKQLAHVGGGIDAVVAAGYAAAAQPGYAPQ